MEELCSMIQSGKTETFKSLLTEDIINQLFEVGKGYETSFFYNLDEIFDLAKDFGPPDPYKEAILVLSQRKDELIPDHLLEVFNHLCYAIDDHFRTVEWKQYLPEVSESHWENAIEVLDRFGLITYKKYERSGEKYPQMKKRFTTQEKKKQRNLRELIDRLLPYLAKYYL